MLIAGLSLRFQVAAIRRGIKQLGVSVGSIFLLFSFESSREAMFVVARGNPRPPPVNDTPVILGIKFLSYFSLNVLRVSVAIHSFMNKRNDSVLPNPYSVIEIEF